jgi:hypothetical protein
LIAIYAKQRELADEQHALARRIAELSRRINPSKQDEDYS